MLMGAMFDAAFRRFAAAFEQRADEIYGAAQTALSALSSQLACQHRERLRAPTVVPHLRPADIAEARLAHGSALPSRAAQREMHEPDRLVRRCRRPGRRCR